MAATATIMAVAFMVVYFVVKETVYQNLDSDLSFEANKHTEEIKIVSDSIQVINKTEWEEKEHREVEVNPVFIQIIDHKGVFMDKSPNLKQARLVYNSKAPHNGHYNETLDHRPIRQVQVPIIQKGELKGFILVAMSMEASQMVLLKLRTVLFISYLVLLLGLYFISRYIAGRGIIPVKIITSTTQRITKNNLNERVNLPENKDELFDLSTSINQLLQRIENAVERERQFTSDASHELRTPLSTLRGTLEVLIRKPREVSEYELKIKRSIDEIDRLANTLEQLLLLARLDSESKSNQGPQISLATLIDEILSRYKQEIASKKIKIKSICHFEEDFEVPFYDTHLILENLLKNAIKYSPDHSEISISVFKKEARVHCSIQDQGIGIDPKDLDKIFDHFFRSNPLEHKSITGNGLGLSIVKKAAQAINAKLRVENVSPKGSCFTVIF